MKTQIIGRSNDCDIVISNNKLANTISSIHAEIVYGNDTTKYMLIDRNSGNGTCVKIDSNWKRIRQHIVSQSDPIMLGQFETTISQLKKM